MAYVGTPIDTRNQFQSLQGKRFNGDGSTTDFTLDVAPASTLDIEVFVGNVRQDPNSAYTLSGTTLSFTGAPPSGTNNIYVVHQAKSVGTIDPPATISTAQTFSSTLTASGALTANGGVVFNEDSADVDFRVESDNDTHAVFVNGANGNIGLGTASPDADLHIEPTTGNTNASLVLSDSGRTQYFRIQNNETSDTLVVNSADSADVLKIDSAGHITKPLQSAFNATSATQNNVTGDETQYQMTFGTETIDRNADFNTNGTFTAPVTGLYLLSANVGGGGFSSHTRMLNFIVTSNRTYIATLENLANTHNGNSFGFNVSCLADMDANDTAFVQVRVDGGSKVIDLDDTCRFSGCLIA